MPSTPYSGEIDMPNTPKQAPFKALQAHLQQKPFVEAPAANKPTKVVLQPTVKPKPTADVLDALFVPPAPTRRPQRKAANEQQKATPPASPPLLERLRCFLKQVLHSSWRWTHFFAVPFSAAVGEPNPQKAMTLSTATFTPMTQGYGHRCESTDSGKSTYDSEAQAQCQAISELMSIQWANNPPPPPEIPALVLAKPEPFPVMEEALALASESSVLLPSNYTLLTCLDDAIQPITTAHQPAMTGSENATEAAVLANSHLKARSETVKQSIDALVASYFASAEEEAPHA